MVATGYTHQDGYYTFNFDDGMKTLVPETAVILVDDGSGLISVKATATRKTIFLAREN